MIRRLTGEFAADVPAILRHRRVRAGLSSALARHPDQAEAAIALLPRLPDHEVEQVVRDWDSDRFTRDWLRQRDRGLP